MHRVLANLIFFFLHIITGRSVVGKVSIVTHVRVHQVRTEKAMARTNSSFWNHSEGSKPDLLCGRPADYTFVKGHFTMLVCSIIVVGGRWWFLNFIFPPPSEPLSVRKVITTTSEEGVQ